MDPLLARRMKRYQRVAVHATAFLAAILVPLASGENPRVLLYAHLLVLPLRMITVWHIARHLDGRGLPAALLQLTRWPTRDDRSVPYRNDKTREPAGIGAYIVASLTLMFMLGVLQALGGGTAFLAWRTLLPEIALALLIAAVFWADDLFGRQLIVAPDKDVATNLGYNVPALNFMLAAIFIGALVMLLAANASALLWDDRAFPPDWVEWAVLVILTGLKFGYQIRRDLQSGGPRGRLPG